jgi:hypothetical protein
MNPSYEVTPLPCRRSTSKGGGGGEVGGDWSSVGGRVFLNSSLQKNT